MFNAENKIGANLHVVKMQGYQRSDWFDETGLMWINPSPNLRTLTQATLYPGVAMVEGANVSVGRGTGTPFELIGAPWIDARDLASYLNKRRIQGVRFVPVSVRRRPAIAMKIRPVRESRSSCSTARLSTRRRWGWKLPAPSFSFTRKTFRSTKRSTRSAPRKF